MSGRGAVHHHIAAARVIDVDHVTKRYGDRVAVDDLTFHVKPGIVTGFLGPNGAGKSTTMWVILGLDTPTSGRSTVNGRSYRYLPAPLHEIGAMLEARAVHTGRSAYKHLLAMAHTDGIPRDPVDPQPAQGTGGGGQDGVPVLPSDVGDGADR